ncbi:glycosyltransferase [Oleomonas cavernae]|uniref:glycosyltransferase n=1 Tax=Oleomonas cavernae TaxID=2320859 RepID=UPI0018F49349|nr:glycosyltransferase [Oleomonas cavernae]
MVQLPPVHCRGVDFRTLLGDDGQPIGDRVRAARIEAMLGALAKAAPDVVVTETFPFGRRQLAAEFLALLETAEARPRRPAILASIRDILNPPSSAAKAVEAQERLGRHYDGVLVHGDRAVAPLDASWPVDPALARMLHYTGYVVEQAPGDGPAPAPGHDILVSGGGSAASLPLFRAAVAAAATWPGPQRWRLLVGQGVPQADFDALAAHQGEGLVVERARPDFTRLLAGAALSVSQAGYNTAIDIAVARVPAVVVPFEQGHEAEQRLRAECFAASGLVGIVAEQDLTPESLARAVAETLARPRPARCPLNLDGIAGSIRVIEDHAGRAAALDRALARAAATGKVIEFWWRDDDAVEPGPKLDRLLDLAGRHGVPLALAVIPQGATAALASRLADLPVAVLVHGLAHRNNAPPGTKKQELGHLPPAALAADLAVARAHLADLFGDRLLPVLVPPWNRIEPELVPLLPAAGFAGLSSYGRQPAAAVPGLVQANSHVDPIDWRGGGGLVSPVALFADLAAHIEAIVDGSAPAEPIGLLTHHLVQDAWTWAWIERFVALVQSGRGTRFISAQQVFKPDCPPAVDYL